MGRFKAILAIIAIFSSITVSYSQDTFQSVVIKKNDYQSPPTTTTPTATTELEPSIALEQRTITPNPLIVSFSPFENLSPYSKHIVKFTDYLAHCLNTEVIYYQMQSNEAEIEAMRAGRLHVAGLSSGTTVAAVERAGAIPFAIKGNANGIVYAGLIVIVRSDSAYQKLTDLKGKRVAHTDPVSTSGHLGALALFPNEGVIPGTDYQVLFSGKHDLSILGVKAGDYDAAVVSLEVFDRMLNQQRIKVGEFRILYQSEPFPAAAITYSNQLTTKFQEKLQQCFFNYRFSDALQQDLLGADRFIPLNYQQDWAYIRLLLDNAADANQAFFQSVTVGSKNGLGVKHDI